MSINSTMTLVSYACYKYVSVLLIFYLSLQFFPLTRTTLIHVIISCGILVWTVVHLVTHFTSFAVDKDNTTLSLSTHNRFTTRLQTNVFPLITGLIILAVFIAMGVSSLKPIRKIIRFVPFHITHWIFLALFYILLVIHGVSYFNHSFWKWLLPVVVIAVLERIYRYTTIPRYTVQIKCAGRYDDQSRTAIIELEKPKRFKFEPGQFILLNLPWIGMLLIKLNHIVFHCYGGSVSIQDSLCPHHYNYYVE